MDYELKRSGTNHYNLERIAKPGEIWTVGAFGGGEKEVLVIKNHGNVCNVLALLDENKDEHRIEIAGNPSKYTDPKMLQYKFKSALERFVKKLPDEVFNYILVEIEDALGFGDITAITAKETLESLMVANKELEAAEEKIRAMEAELREVKANAEEQRKQMTPAVDTRYKDLYQKLVFDLIDRGLMGVVML